MALAIVGLTLALIVGGAFWMGRFLSEPSAPAAPATSAVSPLPVAVAEPLIEAPSASPARESRRLAERAPRSRASALALFPRPTPPSPTDAAPAAVPPAERLKLSGVIEGLGPPYAVMNGRIIGVGERVEEVTVVQIAEGAVTVRHADGTEATLRVSP
jgi:hypothetical protein